MTESVDKYLELRLHDTKFIKWMKNVEEIVEREIQCKLLDLPDELYRDSFDNGMTSEWMAKQVIESFYLLI